MKRVLDVVINAEPPPPGEGEGRQIESPGTSAGLFDRPGGCPQPDLVEHHPRHGEHHPARLAAVGLELVGHGPDLVEIPAGHGDKVVDLGDEHGAYCWVWHWTHPPVSGPGVFAQHSQDAVIEALERIIEETETEEDKARKKTR